MSKMYENAADKEKTMTTERNIQPDTKIVRDSEIIFSEMDGETVMMSIENGEYYGIDPVGSRIWELIETPVKVSGLCEILGAEYKVTPEQCSKDVMSFLNDMLEKGIVKIADEG